MIGKYSVFVSHLYQVGCYAYGAEVEQRDELREWYAVILGKSLHELESHTTSAQVLEGVGIVCALWVEYGVCIRQGIVRHMVVTHYKVYSQALGIGYSLMRLDATIQYYNEAYSLLLGKVYALLAHSVTLVITVGNVVVDVAVELLQKLIHQRHCCASIYIVVAIHQYAFLMTYGIVQSVNGKVHIFHQEGVYQV